MATLNNEIPAEKPLSLQQGKYVFIEELKVTQPEGVSVPYFYSKAIMILDGDSGIHEANEAPTSKKPKTGAVREVKISDLILKQSSYIDENGKVIEAHKLYTWPRNLGSTEQWTACKQEFLNQFVMNFPIQVLSTQESNGVTWKYITPENFKKLPEHLEASADFQEYANHQAEYFFLRRPVNEPK